MQVVGPATRRRKHHILPGFGMKLRELQRIAHKSLTNKLLSGVILAIRKEKITLMRSVSPDDSASSQGT